MTYSLLMGHVTRVLNSTPVIFSELVKLVTSKFKFRLLIATQEF